MDHKSSKKVDLGEEELLYPLNIDLHSSKINKFLHKYLDLITKYTQISGSYPRHRYFQAKIFVEELKITNIASYKVAHFKYLRETDKNESISLSSNVLSKPSNPNSKVNNINATLNNFMGLMSKDTVDSPLHNHDFTK